MIRAHEGFDREQLWGLLLGTVGGLAELSLASTKEASPSSLLVMIGPFLVKGSKKRSSFFARFLGPMPTL